MILTKEKRELLITSYQNDIAYYEDRILLSDNDFDRGAFKSAKLKTEIALEALKAPVLGYIHKYIWDEFKQAVCSGSELDLEAYSESENRFAVYASAPVQEIKLPIIDDVPYSGSKEYDEVYKDGAADVIESIKKLNNIEG